jgi:hypothetical protein
MLGEATSRDLPSQTIRRHQPAGPAVEAPGLLEHIRIVSIARAEQWVWFFISFIGVVWGILTGLSLGQSVTWLPPAVAFFGCGSILALGLTVKAFRQDLAPPE